MFTAWSEIKYLDTKALAQSFHLHTNKYSFLCIFRLHELLATIVGNLIKDPVLTFRWESMSRTRSFPL